MASPPSGLDKDPAAYLDLPRFNHTIEFDFAMSPGGEAQKTTASYALTDAPSDSDWPLLVFFNGMGSHRLMLALLEGFASSHKVQVLGIDKPNASASRDDPIPFASRTRWMYSAFLAIMSHLQRTRFAVLSHSNGTFYALYTLLHLPATAPHLTPTSWTLCGPYVSSSISGSIALRLASTLPSPLPNTLGTLLQALPTAVRAVGWSSGLLSVSAGLFSPASTSSNDNTDEARNQRKPPHRREYLHRYVTTACQNEALRRSMAESRVSIGQEALLTLHGGDAASAAESGVDGGDSVWGIGPGSTDAEVIRNAFTRLAELYPPDSRTLPMNVVYGATDGLVPAQGRVWLKSLLEEKRLISSPAAQWMEVPEAGHDEILSREEVMEGIFLRVSAQ
ncbi:cellobiohydrolase I [Favolaschia claudopus]|uniref:Cellobiohydrolase I n=1 Tax=Favolaschia claudopus TaxID=2862362 RepID=A0AAW0E5K7_9AGAR